MDSNITIQRSKLNGITKTIISYIIQNSNEIIFLNKLYSDNKDILPINILIVIYTLEGLGFIMLLNKSSFIFNGFKGVINESKIFNNLIIEYKNQNKESEENKNKNKNEENIEKEKDKEFVDFITNILNYKINQLDYDDIKLLDKKIPCFPFNLLKIFINLFSFRVAMKTNKNINKNILEKMINLFNVNIKDFDYKNIIKEGINVLSYLNLIDIGDSHNINWIGSDIFNLLGLVYEDFDIIIYNEEYLNFKYEKILENYYNELIERDKSYFLYIITNGKFKDVENIKINNINIYNEKLDIDFEKSYAMLRSKNSKFYIKKNKCIIGRKNHKMNSKINWEVDFDLGYNLKVSKQHGLIIYNFEKEVFEILCISKKYGLHINDKYVSHKSSPVTLTHKSKIKIGKEKFYFLLPKSN